MGVASIVLDDGGSEDEAIGALLHDAAEDHGGRERLGDIRARFGDAVARIVEDCTDSWDMPKRPWAERKRAYVARARTLPGPSLRVSSAVLLKECTLDASSTCSPHCCRLSGRRYSAGPRLRSRPASRRTTSMPQLKQLKPGTRIVSHSFDMGAEWPPEKTQDVTAK